MYSIALRALRANIVWLLIAAAISTGLGISRGLSFARGGLIAVEIFLWVITMEVFLRTMLLGAPPPLFRRPPDPAVRVENRDTFRDLYLAGSLIQGLALLLGIVVAVKVERMGTLGPDARALVILAITGATKGVALLLLGSALPGAITGTGTGLRAALRRAPGLAPGLAWRLLVGPGLVFVAILAATAALTWLWLDVLGLPGEKIDLGNLAPIVLVFVNSLLAWLPTAFVAAALAVVWQRSEGSSTGSGAS